MVRNNKLNEYIGVIDIGTSSVRFMVFDLKGAIVSEAYKQIQVYYPSHGYVEEDANDIYDSVCWVITEALNKKSLGSTNIIGIGITNQRESVVFWDKNTGEVLSPVIVWQDRRTAQRCQKLKEDGFEAKIKEYTGLVVDPYFSATKIEWLLNNDKGLDMSSDKITGTLDSWILFKLTGNHYTDASNASRTLLFNIDKLKWDDSLLSIFGLNKNILPQVLPSFGKNIFGFTKKDSIFKNKIPVCCILGDQQSALFGQRCFKKGEVKCTYGTGAFLMMNIGQEKVLSKNNLLTTIFFVSEDLKKYYALEGSIYNTGTIFTWFKENLGIIKDYSEIEELANKSSYDKDLYLVPGFTGIGAPYWDPYGTGLLIGLNRNTTKNDIVRAGEEAVGFRTIDVIRAMEDDTGIKISGLKIDGGLTRENLFCQIVADLAGVRVVKFLIKEITALGAFFGTAIGLGIFKDYFDIKHETPCFKYDSKISKDLRESLYKKWNTAMSKAINWSK